MTQMMYWYWKTKGIRPSFFQDMPEGELNIIMAFYELELDDPNILGVM